jgi:predicted GTPase
MAEAREPGIEESSRYLLDPSLAGDSEEITAIDKALLDLSFEQKGTFQWWRKSKSNLRIIVVGKTGVGKSTLLNALFGVTETQDAFKAGTTLAPGTKSICTHQYIRGGILLTVHDSPGLEDGSGNESTYFREMKAKTDEGIDLMLYCISMKESRSDLSSEINDSVIDKITRELGSDIWQHTVFVLTFANSYIKTLSQAGKNVEIEFEKRMNEWKSKIVQALIKNGVDDSTANNILVEPASYYKKQSLLKRKFWLSELWARVFVAVSDNGKVAFLKLASDRLRSSAEVTDDDFKNEIQPIVVSGSVPSLDDSIDKSKNSAMELIGRLWKRLCDFIDRRSRKKSRTDLRKQLPEELNTWF